MEQTIQFILDNQHKISNNHFISVQFGVSLFNNGFNIHIDNNKIQSILDELVLSDLEIKKLTEEFRIYKYLQSEYQVYKQEEKHLQYNVHSKYLDTQDSITLITLLKDTENLTLEEFPNKTRYSDIINRSLLKLFINNLLEIHICLDTNCKKQYNTITLIMNKQNIYKDKVRTLLEKVISLIVTTLNQQG